MNLELEERIENIEKRNKHVSLEKKWETSTMRKMAITVVTYVFLGLYMWILGVEKWYLHALVPTVGFILSGLSLNGIKNIRIKSQK